MDITDEIAPKLDKNILSTENVLDMLDKIHGMRLEVCKTAERYMDKKGINPTDDKCSSENCPLYNLCNAMVSVWAILQRMEYRPYEGIE